jgi:outer membrane biosynthesis protein TonB
MKRGGRGRDRFRGALIASALLHAGAIAFFWAFASSGPARPALTVYAVNIVSPPPREAGETSPEQAPLESEPVDETDTAEPEPVEPEPEPSPPTPQPEPRPQPTPPQPAPRPEPQRQQPAPTPPAPRPEPPRQQPPAQREPTPAQRPTTPATEPPRQAEPAPRPAPSTGAQPSPTSPGGENLAVRTDGAVCPSEAYCNNIAAMVRRYFRRPPDSYSDRGDVCFRIARSGAVADLEVQRLRGSFAFRLALMEAVEQAGRRNEFGPLPREFGSDWLPVCVGVTPQM